MKGIRLGKGFKLDGLKVVKSQAHLDVSARIRQRKSKRTRPARRGEAHG